jgi:hypothetical protein
MNVLKVGLLTFHRCINYGSYWQARCLVEGLRSLGHDAFILDHDSRRVNLAEWKCAFQPLLPTPTPASDHPFYRNKIRRFFEAFEGLPLSRRFPVDDPSEMESCDAVVVGSDEVWNLFHPWYGKCPLFYGDGIKARRLISYAASFGNYDASWGLAPEWAEKLRNFESISVRDENSRTIVRNALGIEPELVLDPCLQFPVLADDREGSYWPEPYVAVYGHNFTPAFASEIRRWAAHRRLPLVSIGYRNDWADEQWIDAGPHDFAHFIARSEAVATNFFHGTVFALRYQKPFACETTPYRGNKLRGLMMKVGGEKRLLAEDTPSAVYNACLNTPLEQEVAQNIERLREVSNAYLNQALSAKQLQCA